MIIKTFALYDAKAKAFQIPFYMPTIGMALRAFEDLSRDSQSHVSRHPEDYSLYEVGCYNDENATTENKNPVQLLAVASEFIKKAPINLEAIADIVGTSKNGLNPEAVKDNA